MQIDNMPRGSNAWDIADLLHPEFFTGNPNLSPSGSFSSSSRESTPMSHHLPTPPQPAPYPAFPSTSGSALGDHASDSLFDFLDPADDGSKLMNDAPFDLPNFDFTMPMMMTSPMPAGGSDGGMSDLNALMGMGAVEMGIDPQLVDSPVPLVVMEEEEEEKATTSSPAPPAPQQDRLTLTIAPVKVGGRGSARRGTVQSGGISKKSSAAAPAAVAIYTGSVLKENKENVRGAGAGRGRKTAATLPSPPSSHHEEEAAEEEGEEASPRPGQTNNNANTILTGNALVAHGRKTTAFDLGIDGLSISASFAIPPGTFNVTTPSAVGSSSGLGVNALIGANASGSGFKVGKAAPATREGSVDVDEHGDDLPADWRPSPEMLSKMTSKEKRQLRNKISARNFRVRRKEYISTLELDIAERDRLLEAIRTELGTSLSENVALRQEIAALKRGLLDGRGTNASSYQDATSNLPPPAPLPEKSAADMLALREQQQQQLASSSNLLRPNTQKDLPNSNTGANGSAFWGGAAAGGVLPVHTAFVPSVASGFANMGRMNPSYTPVPAKVGLGLQENMNPLMSRLSASRENEEKSVEQEAKESEGKENRAATFDNFADMNMFTMKSMDAYRMHLWGKMAAQYHWHQQQLQQQERERERQQNLYQHQQERQHLSGLAAGLRPSYFTGVSAGVLSGKASSSSTSTSSSSERLPLANVSNTSDVHHPLLAALLSGKGSTALFSSGKEKSSSSPSDDKEKERVRQVQQQREQQAQAAMLAAVASQTVLRRMGQAFWDAFSGSSSSSSSSSTSTRGGQSKQNWDEDKVRRVLEGKAVVRVVDIEEERERERKSVVPARNVSRGGSWSVPSSPVLGAAVPVSTSASTPSPSTTTPSKDAAGLCDSLEEKMRGLALASAESSASCASAACGGFVRRISRRD